MQHQLAHLTKMTMGYARTLSRPTHLILDWDGTLTTKDTMSLLGELPGQRNNRLVKEGAHTHALPQNIPSEASPLSQSDLHVFSSTPKWEDFFKAYLKDYEPYKLQNFPKSNSHQAYCDYLAGLKPIETRSVQRVQESNFFCGVKKCDVTEVARVAVESGEVELRKGWFELLEMFTGKDKGSRVSILSVNWSATFIRQCLLHAATSLKTLENGRRLALVDLIKDLPIIANDLDNLESPEGSSGQIVGGVQTSADKLSKLPVRDQAQNTDNQPSVCYVGDSATDYESIVAADSGFFLIDETEKPGEKLEKMLGPLYGGSREHTDGIWESKGEPRWIWTSSLERIADFLSSSKEL